MPPTAAGPKRWLNPPRTRKAETLFDRQKKGERALLVLPQGRAVADPERRGSEFADLARSAGAQVIEAIEARVDEPNPRYYIGSGKAEMIAERVKALEADLVLVDHTLSPVQERNLEKRVGARVVDRTKVNPNGGAMALGHPIGATGSILIGTVVDELERTGGRYGLVTMCAAGGMAPAIIIERMDS